MTQSDGGWDCRQDKVHSRDWHWCSMPGIIPCMHVLSENLYSCSLQFITMLRTHLLLFPSNLLIPSTSSAIFKACAGNHDRWIIQLRVQPWLLGPSPHVCQVPFRPNYSAHEPSKPSHPDCLRSHLRNIDRTSRNAWFISNFPRFLGPHKFRCRFLATQEGQNR